MDQPKSNPPGIYHGADEANGIAGQYAGGGAGDGDATTEGEGAALADDEFAEMPLPSHGVAVHRPDNQGMQRVGMIAPGGDEVELTLPFGHPVLESFKAELEGWWHNLLGAHVEHAKANPAAGINPDPARSRDVPAHEAVAEGE